MKLESVRGTNSKNPRAETLGFAASKSRRAVDVVGDDIVDNDVERVSFLSPGAMRP